MLAGQATGHSKAGTSTVEMIRHLKIARDTAVKGRSEAIHQGARCPTQHAASPCYRRCTPERPADHRLASQITRLGSSSEPGRSVRLTNLPRRDELVKFFEKQSPARRAQMLAALHTTVREITTFGHTVKMMPPAYVKPCVKRARPMRPCRSNL